jgi:hypothetical protein
MKETTARAAGGRGFSGKGLRVRLIVCAVLMIVFGATEVATAFRHRFLMLATNLAEVSTIVGALTGALYAAGGIMVLIMRKWSAVMSVICLSAVVAGRITMVAAGLYPFDSFPQIFAIIAGTSIAAFFLVYIARKIRVIGAGSSTGA